MNIGTDKLAVQFAKYEPRGGVAVSVIVIMAAQNTQSLRAALGAMEGAGKQIDDV